MFLRCLGKHGIPLEHLFTHPGGRSVFSMLTLAAWSRWNALRGWRVNITEGGMRCAVVVVARVSVRPVQNGDVYIYV